MRCSATPGCPWAVRALLIGAAVALACAACADTAPMAPAATDAPSVVPSASVGRPDALLGPWQPAPVAPEPGLVAIVRDACLADADPVAAFGLENQPTVLADARGDALVSLILADDQGAFVCRATLSPDAAGAVVGDSPARLDPAALAPLEDGRLRVIDHAGTRDAAGRRTAIVGRVGPRARSVRVSLDDGSDLEAATGDGWFAAWWPGAAAATAVSSADLDAVLDTVAVSGPIEGTVAPAAWWVDPATLPLDPAATAVEALVVERSCADGRPPDGRLLEPAVFAGADALLITIWVRRLPGPRDCPGNPTGSATIRLPEPLRDRRLLDGGEIPPRDALTSP
jgi:hypothetical protein